MPMIKTIEEFKRRLGDLEVHTGARHRLSYTYDATGRRGECLGVVFPTKPEDLCRTVKHAEALGLALFMRGAGTGFSGGSVPEGGGVVVSTEKMRRVLDLDTEGLTVEVECGMVNGELQDILLPHGLFYPPDPASLKVSTIGGNIAENAGGPRAYKYGVTRRYVRSLKWVGPGGSFMESPFEGPASLLCGAEGTMGAVYSARLDVRRLPGSFVTSLVCCGEDEAAMDIAGELLAAGFCPSVLEFIDSKTMDCVTGYMDIAGIEKGQSHLFVEVDGDEDETAVQQAILEGYCTENSLEYRSAAEEGARESLWELRRSISPSLAMMGITKINEDVSVPLGKLSQAVSFIRAAAGRHSLDCYVFGHCGDGNLHVNIMTDRRDRDEVARAWSFVEELFERTVEAGGTLSGEHGIGVTKKKYLPMLFTRAEAALNRGVAGAMDPAGVFNPGKYFDEPIQAAEDMP